MLHIDVAAGPTFFRLIYAHHPSLPCVGATEMTLWVGDVMICWYGEAYFDRRVGAGGTPRPLVRARTGSYDFDFGA